MYFHRTRLRFRLLSDWDDCNCHSVYTLESAHLRQFLAARTLNERSLLIKGLSSRAQKRLKTRTLMTLSFSGCCNFQTCMSLSRPSKCSVLMLCTTSSKCLRMRASVAVHSRKRAPRRRREHSWFPFRTASLAHAHHDASRLHRCKSDSPPTPPRRVGIRPRVPARSIRLPRRGQYCSRDSGMSSEWSSERRASPCQRTRCCVMTNLTAEPCERLHATDASPEGAGGCAASITQED